LGFAKKISSDQKIRPQDLKRKKSNIPQGRKKLTTVIFAKFRVGKKKLNSEILWSFKLPVERPQTIPGLHSLQGKLLDGGVAVDGVRRGDNRWKRREGQKCNGRRTEE